MLEQARSLLLSLANAERKKICQSFFKIGPGEYSESDVFIGVRVSEIRIIARQFEDMSFDELASLISSEIHEERLLALLILVRQFKKNPDKVYEFYLQNIQYVNNWDLVDQSAHYIVGAYLIDKDRTILYALAESQNLWKRRIAMVSTWWFIRNNQFADTIKLAEIFLNDKHDLMHKATGWMLREVGKKDQRTLIDFLNKYSKVMPRTALRYSIEKLTPVERTKYLKKSN
jgi:3-methyladenine DNA glycosylase AlkD